LKVAIGGAKASIAAASDYAGRAVAAGLRWPLPEGLTDTALEALLFVRGGPAPGTRRKPEPDWPILHRELRRPGVTLMLLWQEYRAAAPEGYGYSRFCELCDEWESRLSPVIRQVHPAGERLFVDYAGQTVELVDGRTGEVRTAQVFVAVLGASSYTYAEATWTQTLPDWIGAHVRALTFFGGVPRQIVPDNLKAGVLKANWHEPGLNPTSYGQIIGRPLAITPPHDDSSAGVHPIARSTSLAPCGGGPCSEEIAGCCPSPGDSARHGNVQHSRSAPAAMSTHRRESLWTCTPP
jgi:hypothetical protein